MATTPTQIRIDSDIKKQAMDLFNDLGLDMSGAVNLFLHQCVLRGGLPFSVEMPRYSQRTLDAMNEARCISRDPDVKGYNDMEEFNGCREYLENYVRSDYQRDYQELLEEQIKNIPFFLKTILDNSMFKHNVVERNNLELSILLTLHSMVSLPNKINKQDITKQRVQLNSQLNNWKNNVVLWKVTESVTKELVILYIQKLFSKIYSEVSKTEDEEYLPEDIVKEILNSAWPTYGLNNATMED